ncbi:MAG TPA: hypothetical protein VE954_18510 [Oligoflexus sp.]|uniref:hypothetical protein n=1 Tax=Oligoflexus sp. TaxID=1971216 RepID=UPI002D66F55C|nr:hypothetical protein [Oligoflexus sp.]HYX35094.1 hypothetical protein [Oligoflexus sp.]
MKREVNRWKKISSACMLNIETNVSYLNANIVKKSNGLLASKILEYKVPSRHLLPLVSVDFKNCFQGQIILLNNNIPLHHIHPIGKTHFLAFSNPLDVIFISTIKHQLLREYG